MSDHPFLLASKRYSAIREHARKAERNRILQAAREPSEALLERAWHAWINETAILAPPPHAAIRAVLRAFAEEMGK